MTYEPIVCRFARPVGWVQSRSRSWGTCHQGHYRADVEVDRGDGDHENVRPPDLDGPFPDGTPCRACGAPYTVDAPEQDRWSSTSRVWDTPSGDLEPGCLYWLDWLDHEPGERCMAGWTNCDGRHFGAVCPNGCHWQIDSRASNCALPGDGEHRCWVRSGDPEADPPTVHVAKDGLTCAAGAGSIVCSDYHGFLQVVNGRSTFTAG